MRKLYASLVLVAALTLAIPLAHAQTKISALPAATTPLAGTEVAPVVQGGVTSKVASSAIGFSALDTTSNTCISPLGASFVKAFVFVNDGVTPSAFECATQQGSALLSWDDNNNGILFPANSKLVFGQSNPGFLAGSICVGNTGTGVGACDSAIGFGGTTTGSVFLYRPLVFSGAHTYLNYTGQGQDTTGSTCTFSATLGGRGGGELDASSTGACTVKLNFSGDVSIGNDGFICTVIDETTPATLFVQTAHTATSCTLSGTPTSGDVLLYTAISY